MATDKQIKDFTDKFKKWKQRYIRKKNLELDESATRIMVNSLLSEILGYTELDEIKTEYNIKGEYADYVVQLARKKHFVIEVKAIQIDLSERHLRQSLTYAVNEGIDWIILTNGRQIQIYRVLFKKPVDVKLVAEIDLISAERKDVTGFAEVLMAFSRYFIARSAPEDLWLRFCALQKANLAKIVYSDETVKFIRRSLKKQTGINFDYDEVAEMLHSLLTDSVEIKGKLKISKK
jgi:hypothetical protein